MNIFLTLLPIGLAIVMIGLGLELTINDFKRVRKHPKAIITALFCQLVLLVSLAFIICKLFSLPPLLSVGVMLLAASPGGPTANIFSYLYKGDIALNVTLTAINSIIAAFTLPLILNLSLSYFLNDTQQVGLQFSKIIQVFIIILVPVIIGMLIRAYLPKFAHKIEKFVKYFAVAFLVTIIVGAIYSQKDQILEYILQIGTVTALFCFLSLTLGYFIPKLVGVSSFQARACSFEIGIHNSTLAITIALTVLANPTIAIPAVVYSLFMYIFAIIFGTIVMREKR
ncbi:bile acid:sodium symporter [Acinetobacter sp. ANC 4558]|uniref:bile acid:sodium symporter family protein n=1 Tax=Acinetobacter sp. ANC 4558 TaxID=1977876 RepID=UPI000A347C0D|nr:bile acid:sodium symporter family protein [Acinetobacter sp. ANC 4558]OTG86461.1 bile acid:sodium symporter [Acinetobacter sp. ANC 4558]